MPRENHSPRGIADGMALARALLGEVPQRCTSIVLKLEPGRPPAAVVTQIIGGEAVERVLHLRLAAENVDEVSRAEDEKAMVERIASTEGAKRARDPGPATP